MYLRVYCIRRREPKYSEFRKETLVDGEGKADAWRIILRELVKNSIARSEP